MTLFNRSIRRLCAALPLLLLAAGSARAANHLEFLFPVANGPTAEDDRAVGKPVFWTDELPPIEWILFRPNGGTVMIPAINNPPLGFGVQDIEIRDGLERAIEEWQGSEFDGPDMLDFANFSNDVFGLPPLLGDTGIDMVNLITFRTAEALPDEVLAVTSLFFMENDFDAEDFIDTPVDLIESTQGLELDLDMDGVIDLLLDPREFPQGEIIDTDILFNPATAYRQWPEDRDDVPDFEDSEVIGSDDIQAILTHEMGHAFGLAHTWLIAPTMTPFVRPQGFSFPTNPYETRTIEFDDELALGTLYGGTGGGGITGRIRDGQFLNNNPEFPDEVVIQAPVFLGVPAETVDNRPAMPEVTPIPHPDNIESNIGTVRLIAQVLSGQSLNFGLTDGTTLADVEPAGFQPDGSEVDELTFIGVDGEGSEFDSMYSFPGLAPREDYVIYLDALVTQNTELGLSEPDVDQEQIAINSVYSLVNVENIVELYPREFYGGTGASFGPVDTADELDDPFEVTFVKVTGGSATEGVDIITNVNDTPEEGPVVLEPGDIRFRLDAAGFPPTDYLAVGGDIGDINGDGYLDVGVAVFTGSTGGSAGLLNRIYLNVPKDSGNPGGERIFREVTFGDDEIVGTADDRLPPHSDVSRDLKFGDFNGDGRLDIFVSNAQISTPGGGGGLNRVYLNVPVGADDFRFMDISIVEPGPRHQFGTDDSSQIAIGDIDCDGDNDVIISQISGIEDTPIFVNEDHFHPTEVAIDAAPTADNSPGDDVYTRADDPISTFFPFVGERVLVNRAPEELQFNDFRRFNFTVTNIAGFAFADETFGKLLNFQNFGNPTDFVYTPTPSATPTPTPTPTPGPDETPIPPPFQRFIEYTDHTDRMPPVFPMVQTFDQNGDPANVTSSPMSATAIMPRLGPFFRDSGLDLLSVKAFVSSSDTPRFDAQSGFYDNIDIDGDGIPDGYFMSVNYGNDFIHRNGSALFGIHEEEQLLPSDPADPLSTPTLQLVQLFHRIPLLTGIPQGVNGDTEINNETDSFAVVLRGGFAGIIGDWQYRGSPKPAIFPDFPTFGTTDMGILYVPDAVDEFPQITPEKGAKRIGVNIPEAGEFVGGAAISFFPPEVNSYISEFFDPAQPEAVPLVIPFAPAVDTTPGTRGEVNSVAAADFDNDGDIDIATAETTENTFLDTGNTTILSPPVQNRVFLNSEDVTDALGDTDGWGTMYLLGLEDEDRNGNLRVEQGGSFTPNTSRVSYKVLAGDVDNDGDVDLIELNALDSHQLFLNLLYTKPAVLSVPDDPPLFSDQTPKHIPPVYDGAFSTISGGNYGTGVTSGVAVGDFNLDGRPDLVNAEGAGLTLGDFPYVLMNVGNQRTDAAQVFKPLGAAYPGPRVLNPGGDFIEEFPRLPTTGFFLDDSRGPGAYFDASTADFDGDRVADILFTRNGDGLVLYVNTDTDDTFENFIPDLDNLPDGFFVNGSGALPNNGRLLDPFRSPADPFHLKRQGRRIAVGNFNGDLFGRTDVFIANGVSNSGATNVLLLQNPAGIFIDATETNLPGGSISIDDSWDAASGDFDHDGDIDIIVINESNGATPGCRFLENNGAGVFTDRFDRFPLLLNSQPRSVVVGDFDGLGEPGGDTNGNGLIDPDEVSGAFSDMPSETPEDLDCDGILDPGEDLNGNGSIDGLDLDGDGSITCRIAGIRETSLDLLVTFEGPSFPGSTQSVALFLNDPTGQNPGTFVDVTSSNLPALQNDTGTGGSRAGDIDNDGDLDLVLSKVNRGPPGDDGFGIVQLFLNNGSGSFTNASFEVPYPETTLSLMQVRATDLELLDVDGDGDLDIYVGTTGVTTTFVNTGGLDIMYINRTVGSNLNADEPNVTGTFPPNPLAIVAAPQFGLRNTDIVVEVGGVNFEPGAALDFGQGIAVNAVQFVSPTKLVASIGIDPTAVLAPRAVRVVNPGGMESVSTDGIFNVVGNIPGNAVEGPDWGDLE